MEEPQRYVTVESQYPLLLFCLTEHLLRRGSLVWGGGGGGVVCAERGEAKNQTLIMILPLGVDIIEFGPKRKKMIMVESSHDIHKEEGEKVSIEEDPETLKWEESCLLRFSKFLGMSLEGYEDEVLDLMYKISDRRQKGKGKKM